MARSIYQGSAAAVCQARELSARRRARGLEKKATGSFLLSPFSLFLPFIPSLSPSFFLSVLRSHPQPFSRPFPSFSFFLPFSILLSLSLALSFPLRPLLFPSLSLLLGNFSSLQRTTEAPRRRRRRCRGYAHEDERGRARARASPRPHGGDAGDGAPIHAIPRTYSAHDCRIYCRDALKNLGAKRNAWLRRVHVPPLILLLPKTSLPHCFTRGDSLNIVYFRCDITHK